MKREQLVGKALEYLVEALKNTEDINQEEGELSKALWHFFRPIFEDKNEESTLIQNFKNQPEDQLHQAAAVVETRRYLEVNPDQVAILEALINKIELKL